jgi:hypothetical protein
MGAMDIKGGTTAGWIVCGWFTPDYRPLAEKFAANLAEQNAPFHLWAKPKSSRGWNTWAKPAVALEAMDAYPGATVILMDTDCIVSGDLSPLAAASGDVAITVKARQMRVLPGFHKRTTLKTSSRVVVFHPTKGARAFALEWERRLKSATYGGDEPSMLMAWLQCQDISFHMLDPRYAGDETDVAVPDAIIRHHGAHGRTKGSAVGNLLKTIERRWLRTGRSQAAKRAWRQA